MPNLDELKAKWEEHDRALAGTLRLNRELLTAVRLRRAEAALRRVSIYAAIEAVVWLLIVVALGNFVANHVGATWVAVSGIATDIWSIGMFIALVRLMIGSLKIDYSQPIASIQRRVEAVRVLRIRTTQRGVLFGILLWLPWAAVLWQAVFGEDLYRRASGAWIIANVLFGVGLLVAAIWISRKYGDRVGRSPHLQRLMKDLAGTNLNSAQAFLATVREFERE